jgi:hypothetical protein
MAAAAYSLSLASPASSASSSLASVPVMEPTAPPARPVDALSGPAGSASLASSLLLNLRHHVTAAIAQHADPAGPTAQRPHSPVSNTDHDDEHDHDDEPDDMDEDVDSDDLELESSDDDESYQERCVLCPTGSEPMLTEKKKMWLSCNSKKKKKRPSCRVGGLAVGQDKDSSHGLITGRDAASFNL